MRMDRGALSWFHTSLLTHGGEVILNIEQKFSLKFHLNQNENLKGNLGMLLVLLESSQ